MITDPRRTTRRVARACALVALAGIVAAPAMVTAPVAAQTPAPAPGRLTVTYESPNGFAVTWIEIPHAAEQKLEVKRTSDGDDAWGRVTSGDFGPLPGTLSSYSLTGVATGLDCNTNYNVRLSIRGDGNHYTTDFGAHAATTAQTTECAKAHKITNLRSTTEPGVVTLTWTAPTDAKYTGIKVMRIDVAQSAVTTIYESNNDSTTRYEDRTMPAGHDDGRTGNGNPPRRSVNSDHRSANAPRAVLVPSDRSSRRVRDSPSATQNERSARRSAVSAYSGA